MTLNTGRVRVQVRNGNRCSSMEVIDKHEQKELLELESCNSMGRDKKSDSSSSRNSGEWKGNVENSRLVLVPEKGQPLLQSKPSGVRAL